MLLWHWALLWVRILPFSCMVTGIRLPKAPVSCRFLTTGWNRKYSPDILIAWILGSGCWSRQAALVTRRKAARPLDMGLWSYDLMSPQNCNYLFTCICNVRQAWGTEIIYENLYWSVANDKTTIKSVYWSSPKGLLKCLRKVQFPLTLETDKRTLGTSSKYWGPKKGREFHVSSCTGLYPWEVFLPKRVISYSWDHWTVPLFRLADRGMEPKHQRIFWEFPCFTKGNFHTSCVWNVIELLKMYLEENTPVYS